MGWKMVCGTAASGFLYANMRQIYKEKSIVAAALCIVSVGHDARYVRRKALITVYFLLVASITEVFISRTLSRFIFSTWRS